MTINMAVMMELRCFTHTWYRKYAFIDVPTKNLDHNENEYIVC